MNPMANSPCRGCRMMTHSRKDIWSLPGFKAPLTCKTRGQISPSNGYTEVSGRILIRRCWTGLIWIYVIQCQILSTASLPWHGIDASKVLTCLAALYMCFTRGSFLMIHSPSCNASPPSHDEANAPAWRRSVFAPCAGLWILACNAAS